MDGFQSILLFVAVMFTVFCITMLLLFKASNTDLKDLMKDEEDE